MIKKEAIEMNRWTKATVITLFALGLSATRVQAEEISVSLKNYAPSSYTQTFVTNEAYRENITGSVIPAGTMITAKLTADGISLTSGDNIIGVSDSPELSPLDNSGSITYSKHTYKGSIRLTSDNGLLRLVNTLDLETYVKGVVPYEMSETWGKESNGGKNALKAQAVAARTYALRQTKGGRVINDTVSYQVYGGYNDKLSLSNASVDETSGEVLKSGKEYVDAFFSSSNGGYVYSNTNIWNSKRLPYLVYKEDPYDARSGDANKNWSVLLPKMITDLSTYTPQTKTVWWANAKESFPYPTLLNALKNENGPNTKIIGLTSISSPKPLSDDTYLKTTFTFIYVKKAADNSLISDENGNPTLFTGTCTIGNDKLRSAIGVNIFKSPTITSIVDDVSSITMNGAGWGHGIGMSQWGAYQMSKENISYRDILSFYFPGSVIEKLVYQPDPTPPVDGTYRMLVITTFKDQGSFKKGVHTIYLDDQNRTYVKNNENYTAIDLPPYIVGEVKNSSGTFYARGNTSYKMSPVETDAVTGLLKEGLYSVTGRVNGYIELETPKGTVYTSEKNGEFMKSRSGNMIMFGSIYSYNGPMSGAKRNELLSAQNLTALSEVNGFIKVKTTKVIRWVRKIDVTNGTLVIRKASMKVLKTPYYSTPVSSKPSGTLKPGNYVSSASYGKWNRIRLGTQYVWIKR